MEFSIFVSRPPKPSWKSRKIMEKMGVGYSHIGIIVDKIEPKLAYQLELPTGALGGVPIVFHQTAKGFNWERLSEFKQKRSLVGTKNITKHIFDKNIALGYLVGRCGLEYSASQYWGFIFEWMKPFFRNNDEKGICSEDVVRFRNRCTNLSQVDDPDYYDPRMAWELKWD